MPIIAAIALLAAAQPARRRRGWRPLGSRRRPPRARCRPSPLLRGAAERAAWSLLRELPLGAHVICPKVRLADVVAAAGSGHRAMTLGRHVDFVLVDRRWMPLLVVEVDGPGPSRPERRERERRVDAALAAAGVPLVRLRPGEDWRQALHAAAGASGGAAPRLA